MKSFRITKLVLFVMATFIFTAKSLSNDINKLGVDMSDVEFYIYPSYIDRFASIKIREIEKCYTVKIRFRSESIMKTTLGALTKALIDGASLGDNGIPRGDFRYGILFYGKDGSLVQAMYLDANRPMGVFGLSGTRQLLLEAGTFDKLRSYLDGISKEKSGNQ